MTVQIAKDPGNGDVWLTAKMEGKAQLGAFVSGSSASGDPTLTIYWRGYVQRSSLTDALTEAETFLKKRAGKIHARLIAFGPEKKVFDLGVGTGIGTLLREESPVAHYAAFRAELEGGDDKLILWANVKEADYRGLDAGDNIGICTSRSLFQDSVWGLFLHTLQATRKDLGPETMSYLLGEIATALKDVQFPSQSAAGV
jgi:hypothetical protein